MAAATKTKTAVTYSLMGLVTIGLSVLGTTWVQGQTWGVQAKTVKETEALAKSHDVRLVGVERTADSADEAARLNAVKIDCHEKELSALKILSTELNVKQQTILKSQEALQKAMEKQDDKLDRILGRLPARGGTDGP